MKSETLYQTLKDLAEKLGIAVSERNLKTSGIRPQSGLCRVRDRHVFIMDRKLHVSRKVELLAECLAGMSLENIYVMPAVRELVQRYEMPSFTEGDDPVETVVPEGDDEAEET
ncbi:hypothetical protein ACFL0Q_08500 [Thermodesulfobacteriota bacterium]